MSSIKITNNPIIKAVFIFLFYYLLTNLLSVALYTTLGKYLVQKTEVNLDLISLIDTIVYAVAFIIIYIIYMRRENHKDNMREATLSSGLIVVLLIFLYRILIDPFYKIDMIFGNEKIPVVENQMNFIKNSITLLNMVFLIPIIEEFVFRKIILEKLSSKNNYWISVLFSSLLFSLMHWNFISFDLSVIINSFFLGIILGIIFIRLGVLYSIIAHVIFNLIWFVLNIYQEEYWSFIKHLNFNLYYWGIVLVSLIVICALTIRLIKKPLNN